MLLPTVDVTGKQVGWIDYTKLEPLGIYRHDHKLWTYSPRQEFQEIEILALDPNDIVEMTLELD
jgi:hypothetical protein